jgi:hypothetical protein
LGRADPTRIAAQIVTGIGFLGAGAIIRQGPHQVAHTSIKTTLPLKSFIDIIRPVESGSVKLYADFPTYAVSLLN